MPRKKTPQEIALLAEGGALLARILEELASFAVVGVTTGDIDDRAMECAETYGVTPVLLGYHPPFAPRPYPAAVCTSRNNVVQHGIPSHSEVLHEGDLLDIDMSIEYKGLITDAALTVGIGTIKKEDARLLAVTKEALAQGIAAARAGNRLGDIGHAVQTCVEQGGFSVVEVLCGHGVGYAVHEPPEVLNTGTKGTGPRIEVGHVYAIEPIVNAGGKEVVFDDEGDGYRVSTADGAKSAHFEHTIAITKDGPRILTATK